MSQKMLKALSTKLTSVASASRLSTRRSDKRGDAQHRLEAACYSRRGRSHENEDRVVMLSSFLNRMQSDDDASDDPLAKGFDPLEVNYMAVFDGHGGGECADFMASNLHEHVARSARSARCTTFQDLKFILADAFKSADEEFCMKFAQSKSGACGVVALIYRLEILVAHVGDCRAVLRCNGFTTRLTQDHRANNEEELKRVIANGGKVVNGRVGGVMSPSRSFGDVDVCNEWGDGIIIAEPDITYATLEKEGEQRVPSTSSAPPSSAPPSPAPTASPVFLILGSDGIFDDMSCDVACRNVEATLRKFPGNSRQAAERLVKEALSKTADDCSVALAVWTCAEPATPTRVTSLRFDLSEWDDGASTSPRSQVSSEL